MRAKNLRAAFGVASLVAAGAAFGQSISTGPIATIPVGGTVFSILASAALAMIAWWMLRRQGWTGRRLLSALLPVVLVSGVVGHSIGPAVAATISDIFEREQRNFHNPRGETQSVPIIPVTLTFDQLCEIEWSEDNPFFDFSGSEGENPFDSEESPCGTEVPEDLETLEIFAGLRDVAFTNESGARLNVTSMTLPSLERCSTIVGPKWVGDLNVEEPEEPSPESMAQIFLWFFVFIERLLDFEEFITPTQEEGIQAQAEPEKTPFSEIEPELDEFLLEDLGFEQAFCAPGRQLAPGGQCVVPVSLMCLAKVVIGCSIDQVDEGIELDPTSQAFCDRLPLTEDGGMFPVI